MKNCTKSKNCAILLKSLAYLKKIDLSIAYANKSIVTIWGLIWSMIFFNEIITFKTIIATIFIIIGIIFFNKEEKQ